jgi:hypothetical protein
MTFLNINTGCMFAIDEYQLILTVYTPTQLSTVNYVARFSICNILR